MTIQQIGTIGILTLVLIMVGLGVRYTHKTGREIENDFEKIRK
jgi:hypothetical protein